MSAFRWRLEPVLRLRVFECERARLAHERARNEATAAGARAQATSRRLEEETDALEQRLRSGVAAWELGVVTDHVDDLREKRERETRVARQAETKGESARAALLAAHGRRRALERLREKAAVAHARALAVREQAELDERAQRSHGAAQEISS
ncbi:MAG TPA: flagellar FliJ family protein [Myxococcota bacterium]|jgi:flagellar export protein FliJ|nr:flagellar FliJ family protein [Myxococcota bacterium]